MASRPLLVTVFWLGCATPPPALPQRLASADAAVRTAAEQELEAMDHATRVRFLRDALAGDGPEAIACATALYWQYLDARESARVVELVRTGLRARQPGLDFENFRWILGSSELGELLADFPPAPEKWTRGEMLSHLHRHVRAEHLPALCTLALGPDPELREAALGNLAVSIGYTDQHREVVARTLLALRPDAARVVEKRNDMGVGTPQPIAETRAKTGWPDLLCRTLELVSGASFPESGSSWHAWAARWASCVPPATEDLPLLTAMLRGEDHGLQVAAVHGLDTIPGDPSTALLREAAEDDGLVDLALGSLVRRGDAEALATLTTRAAEDADSLLSLLWAAPARGRDVLDVRLRAPDAVRVADHLREAWQETAMAVIDLGIPWDGTSLRGLAAASAESPLDGPTLAELYAAVPELRTPQLRRLAVERLGRLPEHPWQGHGHEFFDLLELEEPAAVRPLLRRWLRGNDASRVAAAAQDLLRLGDPEHAAELIQWVAHHSQGREDLVQLASRSACPQVEAFLRERAQAEDETARRTALEGLGALHGLPPRTAYWLVWTELPEATRPRVEELLRAGKAIEALVLAGTATQEIVPRAGLIRDARVTALLHEHRDSRELLHHAWAIGELAIQGDAAARADMQQVCADGRYGWIEDADWEALTLNFDLAAVPYLLADMESNCCRFVRIRLALRELVGLEFEEGCYWTRTRATSARRFFQRYGARLRWSRVAGRFLVV